MPVPLRNLENPEGSAAKMVSFWDVRSLASPELSSSAATLLLSKDAQDYWSEKAHQAFGAGFPYARILPDRACEGGHSLATEKGAQGLGTLINQVLLAGAANDVGQTRQQVWLLLRHSFA